MSQAGVHAFAGLYLKKFIRWEKWLFPSIVFGALLPDIDSIFVAFATLFTNITQTVEFFHRKGTHSFFFILVIYLTFSVLSEWKKDPVLKTVGKGLAIGIICHILLDTLFWFQGIYFLWPLDIQFNLWSKYEPAPIIFQMLNALEFLFFRIYAWVLIQLAIQTPPQNFWFLKFVNIWRKLALWIFIICIISILIDHSNYFLIFGIFYIPFLLMALFSTYILRDTLDADWRIQKNTIINIK